MRVSSTRTIVSGNGAVVGSGNGRRAGYDRWRMNWNGNMFAPPDSGAVLYLPGHPGVGSTITDFSHKFLDSGIDTDEALDDSETGVDCDADATTAIPANSVIRVEDELMYVTATGTTLTVVRGYAGSVATSHDTNKDIYIRTKNDGTITGAIWKRLPSGLWYLDYDATDDEIVVTKDSSIDITGKITIKGWYYPTGWGEDNYGRLFNKGAIYHAHWLKGDAVEGVRFRIGGGGVRQVNTTDGTIVLNKWQHIVCVYDQVNMLVYVDTTLTTGDAYSGTIDDSSADDLYIGSDSAGNSVFGGGSALFEIIPDGWSADDVARNRAEERHLFSV